MCSKLSATFVPFSVLSLIHPHTIKVASTTGLSFALFTQQKIPGSPRLHNFNVRIPECGSLGTRLSPDTIYSGHKRIMEWRTDWSH